MSRISTFVFRPRSWMTILAGLSILISTAFAQEARTVMSLDGDWQIAEGSMDQMPSRFDHQVPVPGLVDMAKPFVEVGTAKSGQYRQAFWYRRTFRIEGEVPAVAILKLHKAAYGSRVWLNGHLLGEHLPSFTPGYFDARVALRAGAENELIVRVGAYRDALPPQFPNGWDFEKVKYIPGLYDSVELILSGTPNIVRVQAAPDITHQTVRVQALLRNSGPPTTAQARFIVREAQSGKVVGTARSTEYLSCERRRGDGGRSHPDRHLPAVVTGRSVSLSTRSQHWHR